MVRFDFLNKKILYYTIGRIHPESVDYYWLIKPVISSSRKNGELLIVGPYQLQLGSESMKKYLQELKDFVEK
jgi:uncharacterized protein YifN (PemK superfamily)